MDVISLALGEPQHPAPEIVRKTVNDSFSLWGKYPPVWGTPEFRAAIVRWMGRRYGIDTAMIDADRSVTPVSGTHEAQFMIAQTATPETVSGGQPLVLMLCAVAGGGAVLLIRSVARESELAELKVAGIRFRVGTEAAITHGLRAIPNDRHHLGGQGRC